MNRWRSFLFSASCGLYYFFYSFYFAYMQLDLYTLSAQISFAISNTLVVNVFLFHALILNTTHVHTLTITLTGQCSNGYGDMITDPPITLTRTRIHMQKDYSHIKFLSFFIY